MCECSAWRPTQPSPAEKVDMEVIHGLPSVTPAIDDETIAVGKTEGTGELRRDDHEMPQQTGVVGGNLGE